jgi:hypothetical protein
VRIGYPYCRLALTFQRDVYSPSEWTQVDHWRRLAAESPKRHSRAHAPLSLSTHRPPLRSKLIRNPNSPSWSHAVDPGTARRCGARVQLGRAIYNLSLSEPMQALRLSSSGRLVASNSFGCTYMKTCTLWAIALLMLSLLPGCSKYIIESGAAQLCYHSSYIRGYGAPARGHDKNYRPKFYDRPTVVTCYGKGWWSIQPLLLLLNLL